MCFCCFRSSASWIIRFLYRDICVLGEPSSMSMDIIYLGLNNWSSPRIWDYWGKSFDQKRQTARLGVLYDLIAQDT